MFASQNELGRLCEEKVYQNDIPLRLQAAGLGPVAQEMPIAVSLRDFAKTYLLDLVVQEALVVELKTVATLTREHQNQLLNYLLITEARQGKLINLRSPAVEYRTVNAVVSAAERRRSKLAVEVWRPRTARCDLLADLLHEMLRTWGAFLDYHLYEDALIHFLGGEHEVLRPVPLQRAGLRLGSQRLPLLTDAVAFRVTALSPNARRDYADQLRRFLALTPLAALHWINLHHYDVRLTTITR